MSELIGTVHKPPQPPIPEPEGWIPIALEEWAGKKVWLVPEGVCILFESQKTASLFVDSLETPYRLVHIGHAPKVPVEAIQLGIDSIEALGRHQTGPVAEHYFRCANELLSWLSAQEEGDK